MTEPQKHILILSSWYPNEKHPFLGNFVERQAALLAERFLVTVIDTQANPHQQETELKVSDHKGYREIIIHYQKGSSILSRKRRTDAALALGFERVEKVDLILGHVMLSKGLQFTAAKKHYKCPLIYVEHGSYFRPEERKKWGWKERLVLSSIKKYADEIVAVSRVLSETITKDFPNREIQVIGNHVDLSLFSPSEKSTSEITRFLHVSTLDKKTKNPTGIIEACAILKESTDQFELTIISDEDYKFLEESVRIKKLADQIKFVGPQSWEEMPPYFQEADAFLLFSDYESFSIVIAEAWATGTPVISTPVGIAEYMSDFLGVLVQKRNPQALANGMLKFINDERHYNTQEISDYAKHFGKDVILKRWVDLIHKHVE